MNRSFKQHYQGCWMNLRGGKQARGLSAAGSKKRWHWREISKRQKVIHIADKSLGGWATVDEYDELASDSDNDKRIRQAENRLFLHILKSEFDFETL